MTNDYIYMYFRVPNFKEEFHVQCTRIWTQSLGQGKEFERSNQYTVHHINVMNRVAVNHVAV